MSYFVVGGLKNSCLVAYETWDAETYGSAIIVSIQLILQVAQNYKL